VLDRVVVYKDVRRDGTYAVRLWQGGRWVCIVVDDRFPVTRGEGGGFRPLFARPRESGAAPGAHTIWMMIVEKAFAKAYGSYAILNGGSIGSGTRAAPQPRRGGQCRARARAQASLTSRAAAWWR
jgi:calpain-15